MNLALSKWTLAVSAVVIVTVILVVASVALGVTREPPKEPAKAGERGESVLNHTMKRIDGTDEDLSVYRGKVVLIVNVASRCGLTPQYEGLQKLYDEKRDAGLVVLGFPANNFMGQEPGTDEEIKTFCENKYSVTFPMFSKVSVKGDDICDLYKVLASQQGDLGGEPDWNFAKWVLDREGRVAAHYSARTKPADPAMVSVIDQLLAEPAPDVKPADPNQPDPQPAEPPKSGHN